MADNDTSGRRLFRLVYASRFTGAERQFDDVLRSVIAKSIQNNRLVDVTGFLIAGERRFLQLLEGPADSVAATYARIGGDPRHADLTLLGAQAAEQRLFRDWNMGQHRLTSTDRALLLEVGCDAFEPDRMSGEAAVRLLSAAGARHLR